MITRPDPMTAAEWEACLERDLAEDLDPEKLQWEDDFLDPDADLTEAELTEIARAMRARAAAAPGGTAGADPAGVAQVLAAQAAAASARRRGPGQPGSARRLAGESSSAAAGFGTGMLLDVMPACPDLAVLASRAAGDDDCYAGASDDELIGVLCAWDRLEAHMAARKLAAVTELGRPRPVLDAPSPGRQAGSGHDDFCADELAHVLAESRRKESRAGRRYGPAPLRHLAQVRHATCTSPVCRRPASQCDFEHNTPYEAGGRTCLCNADPKCRHDHKLKQHPRWKVDQLPDGALRWTTPSGRQYTSEPTRYPI